MDAVAKTDPTISRANFVVQVTKALPGIQIAAADELVRAVLGMQAARIAWEATAEEFVKALAAAENVAESKGADIECRPLARASHKPAAHRIGIPDGQSGDHPYRTGAPI